MKNIRAFCIFLIICLLLSAAPPAALALQEPSLSAKAAIVIDLSTGEVLYEKNADEQRSPASLTKIMTGLLAVEAVERGEVSMDETVTAGLDCQNGLDQYSSNASIVAGEKMSFRDYLYCAMVVSANEACNVLGSRISGSIGGFVDLMNRRAEELGCTSTHFSDTNGLTSRNHYTTARELSVIMREALKHEEFMTAFTAQSYLVPASNVNAARELKNSNALITNEGYYAQYGNYLYDYALGGKTGYTRAAGYCLASVAEKDGLRLLCIVMGCPGPLSEDSSEPENFKDTIELYNWVYDNFSYEQVLSSAEPIERVEVEQADGDGTASLYCMENLTLLLPKDVPPETRELEVTIREELLKAPIPAGTVLGTATLRINGRSYGPYELVNTAEVKLAHKEYIREQVDSFFARREVRLAIILLALVLVLYFALVLRYRALRRKHLRERKLAEKRRKAAQELRRQEAEAAREPTLRFTAADPDGLNIDGMDLSRFFEEPVPRPEKPAEPTGEIPPIDSAPPAEETGEKTDEQTDAVRP